MIRLRTLATIALLAIGPLRGFAAQAPADPPLTLEQAIAEALQHNATLIAERLNVEVADAAVVTAGLRPNPVITASLMRPDQALVDAGISPYEQVFRTDYEIEGGNKRQRRLDVAALSKSVAGLQLSDTVRLLRLDVEIAVNDLQLAKRNLALAQENLEAFDNVVRINAERVRAGDLSQLELSRSQLAARQFQNDVRLQEARQRGARIRLATLLGRTARADTVDVIGDLRHDAEPFLLDQLRRQALDARPDLQALRTDQARALADTRLQQANGAIDYTVSGEYHRQEGSDVRGNSYGAFFSVPLPIFSRNQGEISRAQAQQRQAGARVQALEQAIAGEVARAFDDYSTSRDIVDNIEAHMLKQAADVRAATDYSYRRGEAGFVDLLDAVRAYNDTMQSYNEARAAYARSLYTLDSISGKVTP